MAQFFYNWQSAPLGMGKGIGVKTTRQCMPEVAVVEAADLAPCQRYPW